DLRNHAVSRASRCARLSHLPLPTQETLQAPVRSPGVSSVRRLLKSAASSLFAKVLVRPGRRGSNCSSQRRFLEAISNSNAIAIISMVMLLLFSGISSFMHSELFYIQPVSPYVFHP
ncbi:hypothetical protein, partial [Ensifer aridi]|uniref:hypothetical protein n=1 Tax=Ensifer aridi TaxID=1708715 RepID=UPI001AECB8C5